MVSREILERGFEVAVKQSTHNISSGGILKRDLRDPETLGKAISAMKESFPNKSAPERADLLDNFQYQVMPAFPNGNGNGKK